MAKLPKASYPITKKIWFNGKLVDWHKATTHVMAHALHYGSGVFEGIRFYETPRGPVIFRLKEHVDRLFYSASVLEMQIPFTKKQVTEAIIQTVKINKVKSGYIRPLAYFGYGKMGLSPIGAPVDLVVACWPWGSYLGGAPIKVQTSKYIRIHPKSLVPDAKVCGHYVNSILASLEMQKAKCDEALLLDYRGYVAEGPGENIFFVKKGVLHTPADGAILKSITRETVVEMAKNLKLKVKRGNYKLVDIYKSDEAFFVGTAAEVQPIGILDGKKINSGKAGPITTQLRELYLAVAAGEVPKYKKFLTFVNA
jgi:branched-chain amino acid aminotransferase